MLGNQTNIQRDLAALGATVNQQLEDVMEMMEDRFSSVVLRRAESDFKKLRQSAFVCQTRQEIIIAGGFIYDGETIRTAETASLPEVTWSTIAPMNCPRGGAASCFLGDDLLVTGGCQRFNCTNTMEILKFTQQPRRWIKRSAKLPASFYGHRIVYFQGKLLVVGGYNYNESKPSNAIFEVLLSSPYTIKLLHRMTQPRVYHRVELVNGRLFILGGSSANTDEGALDSVLEYDVEDNECHSCLPLPKAIHHMSTVTWRNNIILFGGTDKDGNDLNEVTMYNTETETSTRLPSMKYKRRGSSAIIFHDRIFVMGGRNHDEGYLSSVESLKIGDYRWHEHEDLRQARHLAIAHGLCVSV